MLKQYKLTVMLEYMVRRIGESQASHLWKEELLSEDEGDFTGNTIVWEKFDSKNFSLLVWHNENWMSEIEQWIKK